MEMEYKIINTGSQGNAVVINGYILIDAGVSYKALNRVESDLKCVLLTHIHKDHFNPTTIRLLATNRPTLRFICCEWLKEPLLQAGVKVSNIDVLNNGKLYDYRLFRVSPIKLYHDVENCGYRLFIDGKRMMYATDTNTLDGIKAKDYDLYMIEANYDEEDIRERLQSKLDNDQYAYEFRVLRTHLSRQQCDEWLMSNMSDTSQYVYLHQHVERE